MSLQRRTIAWLIVAIFATMPLAWISPKSTGLGEIRLAHAPAFVLVLMTVPFWPQLGRQIWLLIAATSWYTVSLAAFSWYHGVPPFAIQQAFYIGAAFAAASFLCTATPSEWSILRWCGPAALGTFLLLFFIDARRAGVDPINIYLTAVRTGDLIYVQYLLYLPVFNARLPPSSDGGVAVLPNISHEVFSAILLGIFVTLYARTAAKSDSRAFRLIYWGAIVISGGLIALSLSRSVQLVALLTCLMPVAKILLARGYQWVTIPRVMIIASFFAVLVGTPITGFVMKRITADTASYGARGSAISLALDSIADHPFTGTNRFAGVTRNELIINPAKYGAHNLVLEAAVIGGIMTGLFALAVLLILALDTARTFRTYLTDSSYLAPLAGGIMGVAWMFTTGRLNQPEWMGIALLYGATRRRLRPIPPDAAVAQAEREPRVRATVRRALPSGVSTG